MSIGELFTKLALACLKYDTVTCKKSSIYEYELNVISGFHKSKVCCSTNIIAYKMQLRSQSSNN